VTALARAQDGTWRVTVELLELARIPETDDLLGSYGAQLDDGGELLRYRRLRRYPRSRG
jgi:Gas vesicle synthesis protein GvpO